jgi:ribonucleotide monophosphatase NagD (HAD superfamily)
MCSTSTGPSTWATSRSPGAARVLARLREPGRRVVFVSNNPTRDPEMYAAKLRYRKLQTAFDAIWFHRRARLVATNPDRWCPFPGGRGEPDAIVAAVPPGQRPDWVPDRVDRLLPPSAWPG